jgi:hypothetical protein
VTIVSNRFDVWFDQEVVKRTKEPIPDDIHPITLPTLVVLAKGVGRPQILGSVPGGAFVILPVDILNGW